MLKGAIAQRLEQRTHNPLVAGSNPACPILSTTTSERVFGDSRITSMSSNYAKITQLTGKDWSRPAQLITYLSTQSCNRVSIKGVEDVLFKEWQFASKYRQLFIQMRKKCVISGQIGSLLLKYSGILCYAQRIAHPLFPLIPSIARVFSLTGRSHGKH